MTDLVVRTVPGDQLARHVTAYLHTLTSGRINPVTTPANPPALANIRAALHAEADELEADGGMVSAHWVASHLRFIADHGRRWPQPGEGPHISHGRSR